VLARLGLPEPADVQGGVLPRIAHPFVAELHLPPRLGDRGSFRALFEADWKYVETSLGATMLYDLVGDPVEKRDRSHEQAERTQAMAGRLGSYLAALERAAPETPDSVVDPDTVRALEALGYMGTNRERRAE